MRWAPTKRCGSELASSAKLVVTGLVRGGIAAPGIWVQALPRQSIAAPSGFTL